MNKMSQQLSLFLAPLFGLIFYFLPTGLAHNQQSLCSIMIFVSLWWLVSPVPLFVTGLVGLCLTTLLGVSSFKAALSGFSNPVIFLFFGGFILARAMSLHKVDTWIAHRCMEFSFVKNKPRRIFIVLVLLTTFFSGFLSNTATAAMFIPIALSILTHLKIGDDHPSYALLLMIAYAASIGGIGTPLGSPPNIIALSLLKSMANIEIPFMLWVAQVAPILVFSLAALFLVFRSELNALPDEFQHESHHQAKPLNRAQKKMITILSITIFLWILPGSLQLILGSKHALVQLIESRLPESLVAVSMASLLFLIPNEDNQKLLHWHEVQNIDWGTLLLFGSGISLGQMMFDTQLSTVIGQLLPFEHMSLKLTLFVIILLTIFISELVSNTALANLMIPLIISTPSLRDHQQLGVMCVALAASLAFMMPVGTPPNAIAFGTGKVKLRWMIRKGLLLNISSLFIIWIFCQLLF